MHKNVPLHRNGNFMQNEGRGRFNVQVTSRKIKEELRNLVAVFKFIAKCCMKYHRNFYSSSF